MSLTPEEIAKELIELAARIAGKIEAAAKDDGPSGPPCLQCGEPTGGQYSSRGLCSYCYPRTYRKIKAGEVTEKELIDAGLWRKDQADAGRKGKKRTKLDELLSRKEVTFVLAKNKKEKKQ